MKRSIWMSILCGILSVFLCASILYAESLEAKPNPATVKSISAVIKKYAPSEKIEKISIDKVIGNYALAIVSVKDGDGSMVYLKKADNKWVVMFYGKSVAEESLVDMGVPKNIAKKLAD